MSAAVFTLIAVGFACYFPLLSRLSGNRTAAFDFFLSTLLPWALGHTAVLIILMYAFLIRARGAAIFWAVSALAVVCAGGWPQAKGLVLMVLMAGLLMALGRNVARILLDDESRTWAIHIGFGVLCSSLLTSYLAWLHWLKWWILAPLLLLSLILSLRQPILQGAVEAWKGFSSRWNFAVALALQALFLLTVFAYVYTVAPEMQSDALRSYWPYVRLMRLHSGFTEVPQVWAYIIPQAGMAYAATVMTLFRERAVQLSSLLIWLILIGLVCRRRNGGSLETRLMLALVVASSPVVLWVATSLMQDCFVCLAAVMFAILCLEGKEPQGWRFWAAIGLCAGLAWAAKYPLACYVLPFFLIAVFRSWKAGGWIRTAAGAGLAGVTAFAALLPWLWNSYRQCGNPVFPLFLNLFPSRLWPHGVGFSNLDSFRLPPGPRGWFLWVIDLTYNTSRFVEGYDGKLGLTLLVFFLMAILALWKGTPQARVLILCSALGTGLLISMTAYLRYWLSGLWLVALALPAALAVAGRSRCYRSMISAATFALVFAHSLMTMYGHWPSEGGWPWSFYSQRTNSTLYLAGTYRGLDLMEKLQKSWNWPKIWYTGYDAVGHYNVQPMEAAIWELRLHVREPREWLQYLTSPGCRYWVVNYEEDDAHWLRVSGIARYFWRPDLLVGREGPIRAYQMRTQEEVLRAFDERSRPGADLVDDGSFEDAEKGRLWHWVSTGDSGLLEDATRAYDGRNLFRLGPGGSVRQEIALPLSLKALQVEAHVRGTPGGPSMPFRWNVIFKGFEPDSRKSNASVPQSTEIEIQSMDGAFKVDGEWKRYSGNIVPVPPQARWAVLWLENGGAGGDTLIDGVSLYSRP